MKGWEPTWIEGSAEHMAPQSLRAADPRCQPAGCKALGSVALSGNSAAAAGATAACQLAAACACRPHAGNGAAAHLGLDPDGVVAHRLVTALEAAHVDHPAAGDGGRAQVAPGALPGVLTPAQPCLLQAGPGSACGTWLVLPAAGLLAFAGASELASIPGLPGCLNSAESSGLGPWKRRLKHASSARPAPRRTPRPHRRWCAQAAQVGSMRRAGSGLVRTCRAQPGTRARRAPGY